MVKLRERGQVTFQSSREENLDCLLILLLIFFEWRGMVVIVPVELKGKPFKKANLLIGLKTHPKNILEKLGTTP